MFSISPIACNPSPYTRPPTPAHPNHLFNQLSHVTVLSVTLPEPTAEYLYFFWKYFGNIWEKSRANTWVQLRSRWHSESISVITLSWLLSIQAVWFTFQVRAMSVQNCESSTDNNISFEGVSQPLKTSREQKMKLFLPPRISHRVLALALYPFSRYILK